MAQRNPRANADEAVFFDDSSYTSYTSSSGSSYRSRRSSRSSFKDDFYQFGPEMEQACQDTQVKDFAAPMSCQNNANGVGDSAALEKSANLPPLLPITSQAVEYPIVPLKGQPINFGVIVPGFYRSSYPKPPDFDFIKSLQLKTLVTLVRKDHLQEDLDTFVNVNGIRQVTFDMKGTKKEAIPIDTMASILQLALDKRNYPLLIHCNQGKHRTGCVVAAARRVAGWNLETVIEEYRAFASPKSRDCDIDYIHAFQFNMISRSGDEIAASTPVRVSYFVRTLLFSTVIILIWLVSGSAMTSAGTGTATAITA